MMRMMRNRSKWTRIYPSHITKKLSSFSADEVKAFESIMKLERGFRDVVGACATDIGAFTALIKQVCCAGIYACNLLSKVF
jgi:hypothetical protein